MTGQASSPPSRAAPRATEPARRRWAVAASYTAGIVVCVTVLVGAMGLTRADLSVPFTYVLGGDALFVQMLVKGSLEQGWHLHIPALGAPGALRLEDWPLSANLVFVLLRLAIVATGSFGAALNLYYLATFPLTFTTFFAAATRLGVSPLAAWAPALLYSFLPYHYMRGESHLLLASYFAVPLAVWLAALVAEGRAISTKRHRAWMAGGAVCLLLGSSDVYYAVFSSVLFLLAGLLAWSSTRRPMSIAPACVLAGTTMLIAIANLAPSFVFFARHGNLTLFRRTTADAMIYGLKLADLLMPAPAHRLETLRILRQHYLAATPPLLTNEGVHSSPLGVLGACGLLALLAVVVLGLRTSFESDRGALVLRLARMNLGLILLGTVGGLGSLVAILVSPQIRAYNRLSVFVGAFALLTVGLALDRALEALRRFPLSAVTSTSLIGLVLVIGLLDQLPPSIVRPPHAENEAAFAADRRFVHQLESVLAEGAMVFQLPVLPFPTTPSVERLGIYDQLRPYLHSRHLRWSFGAVPGRPGWDVLAQAAGLPLPQMLELLRESGFAALLLHGNAYPGNRGKEMAIAIGACLGEPLAKTDDGRLIAFPIRAISRP